MTDSTPRQITITNSQVGVIGDGNTIYGGIHFYQHLAPQPVDEAMLTAALERLAAMPVDRLPDPGALPPGSRMIFRRNPLFVGREADLLRLAATLKGGGVAAIGQIAAATGLGGIGKTQLATEFAHRYGQFFAGGVFWLSFADPQSVPAEIAACGGPGALDLRPDFGNLPLEDQVRLVLSVWCGPQPRLLIFDNCEDEDLLARWLPPGGGARVLVTSRRGQWNAELGVTALRLDVLPRAESVILLRKHRPDLSDADADEIAEELGDLPLALHVAGSFLATYRHAAFGTPQAYLADLRRAGLAHPSLTDEGETLTTAHARHVGRTFALSYERLDPQNPTDAVALTLLARCAYFAPGIPIPRDLLLKTLDLPEDNFEAVRQVEDGLMRLVDLGLLELEDDTYPVLHRLLAAFVREGVLADDVTASEEAQTAVEETVLTEARRLNKAGYPAPLLAWRSHLGFVTDAAQARGDERSAKLCDELASHLKMTADYPLALTYCERALAVRRQVLGSDHADTALNLNALGELLYRWGELERAESFFKQALIIQKQVLGYDHPSTALTLTNWGNLLRAQGDLEGAHFCYEHALQIRERTLGVNHRDTAQSLSDFGGLLRAQGNLSGARFYYQRALAIREQILGSNHVDTAQSLNNLGILLQDMKKLTEALPNFRRALAIREQVLGPDHPATAASCNNLGGLLHEMGDRTAARTQYQRALEVFERTYGTQHIDTATSLNNLAVLHAEEGDSAQAAPLMRRALAVFEARLGHNHPNTQKVRQSLAAIEERLQASSAESVTED